MCKHIHAACISDVGEISARVVQETRANATSTDVCDEIELHVRTLQATSKKPKSFEINKLSLEIAALTSVPCDIDAAILGEVVAYLKAPKRLLQVQTSHRNHNLICNKRREPANKLLSHQKRFFSLKHKIHKKQRANKASPAETVVLDRILTQNELLINNGQFDLAYESVRTKSVSLSNNLKRSKPKNSQLLLSNEDQLQIKNLEMLMDKHMEVSMTLLKMQFPNVNGLEPTVLSQLARGFSTQVNNDSQVIQIHYNGSLHWVTSTRACKDEFVYIYDSYSVIDSSGRPRLAASLQLQVAQIYRCASNEMPILLPEMSRQCNGVDCGLYAIATATDLCFGNNPAERNYDQSQMRAHLLKCIQIGRAHV